MKKLLGIFMAAVTVFAACVGFAGCNKGDAGQGAEEPPKTEEPAVIGEFKSLKDAYDAGLISHDELKSIAYYYNNRRDAEYYENYVLYNAQMEVVEYKPSPEAGFVPIPKSPEILDEETVMKIKKLYQTTRWHNLTLDKISVSYYGKYGDYIAVTEVVTTGGGGCAEGGGDPFSGFEKASMQVRTIGDVLFYGATPRLWCPVTND